MRFQRFIFLLAICILVTGFAFGTSAIDVRLNHNTLDKSDRSLFVDIEVKVNNNDHVILAGQNYRIYYPSSKLKLNRKDSKSQLSSQKYSDLLFTGIKENVRANGQGAIDFDEDLGFANFSVQLLDYQKGGASVSHRDGWVTIATLKFDIVDDFEKVSMVWGREGLSASYATAFVEIAEWKAPLQTREVNIEEYIDYSLSLSSLTFEGVNYDIAIGPNPATDFVEIKADKTLAHDVKLIITDLTGKMIQQERLLKGNKFYNIDVSELQSASYILDITAPNGNNLLTHKLVLTR